jgi:hypothetical protein
MGVLALGAAPANAPGAVGNPEGSSFGATLSHAITVAVDRERPSSTRGRGGGDTPPVAAGLARRLMP